MNWNAASRTLDHIVTTYGPYAFGVAAFLIIWQTSVAPQLKSLSLDWQRLETSIHEVSRISERTESTLNRLNATVNELNRTLYLLRDTIDNATRPAAPATAERTR